MAEDAKSPTSKPRTRAAERRERALALRAGGASYKTIGDALGISAPAAFGLVKTALQESIERTREAADELREMELQRLETMQASVWELIVNSERVARINGKSTKVEITTDERLAAIDRLLRIQQRRAALTGVDMPTKVAPTDPTGTKEYGELTDAERSERVAALLDAARARRTGQADSAADLHSERESENALGEQG